MQSRLKHFIVPLVLGLIIAGCAPKLNSVIDDASITQILELTPNPKARAHWVSADTVLLPEDMAQNGSAYLVMRSEKPQKTRSARLVPTQMPEALIETWPHLRGLSAFSVPDTFDPALALQQEVLLAILDEQSGIAALDRVQIAGVLDDIYTAGDKDADEIADLGLSFTETQIQFKLWAPTAQSVSLKLYDSALTPTQTIEMRFDDITGAWAARVPHDAAKDAYYRYEVSVFHPKTGRFERYEVTDPYSVSLSANSEYSHVLDLSSPDAKPAGWDDSIAPEVERPEQLIIYEIHIGDFSGTDSSLANPAQRGTYSAFSSETSDGIEHLKTLQEAGLNTIHLLPAYDIGTVNEFKDRRVGLHSTVGQACALIDQNADFCTAADPDQTLLELLQSYDPNTGDAQDLVEAINEVDDFNWGYDPVHYTVPEGSYAVDPMGAARITEFRSMVQRLHGLGFRVVMDVVYNHTYQSGLNDKSVLDKIVPNYYHRLHPETGQIETSTCCENTATEHVMMGKLMTDSLAAWAQHYKIDGFRFDLMGHQPRDLMLRAREAVRAVDPDTYFYGEGWNFGEVVNNARFRQASQLELPGTDIGTFTDRLRDAVRGGSSFVSGDDLRKGQGLVNGILTAPNELAPPQDETRQTYDIYMDQVRTGLAGNLADFAFTGQSGSPVTGKDIPYGGAPAGYAADPADTINYVSKHDNQTLWDNNQYRIPFDTPAETRMRMQMLALSYPLYAQGIPFLHMGGEFMRSKAFLRDSYNFGHWFNAVDFSKQNNNYNAGLPPSIKDKANWDIITRLRAANSGRDQVTPDLIADASGMFMDMLAVRSGSALFSLPTQGDIQSRIRFLAAGERQQTGLLVMAIDDGHHDNSLIDLDPGASEMIIIFNHSPARQNFAMDTTDLALHPRLQNGADETVKTSLINAERVSVPAWTTAVFVRAQ